MKLFRHPVDGTSRRVIAMCFSAGLVIVTVYSLGFEGNLSLIAVLLIAILACSANEYDGPFLASIQLD